MIQKMAIRIIVCICILMGCNEETQNSNAGKMKPDNTNIVKQSIELPNYRIVETEPCHYSNTKRYTVRVRVNSALKSKGLKLVSYDIIEKYKVSHPHNTIMIFFYLPESSTSGLYTAGKAVWAPYGGWGKASDVTTGDYSRHELIVETANEIGNKFDRMVFEGISLKQKQKMFYEVVQAQDRGVGDNKAYTIIALKYNIEETLLREITWEGVVNGWPVPER